MRFIGLSGSRLALLIIGAIAAFIRIVVTAKIILWQSPDGVAALFANPVVQILFIDVILATLAFTVWLFAEQKRRKTEHVWTLPVIALILGVTVALCLYYSRKVQSIKKSRRRHKVRERIAS